MNVRYSWLAGLTLLVVAIAGCGGDGSSTGDAGQQLPDVVGDEGGGGSDVSDAADAGVEDVPADANNDVSPGDAGGDVEDDTCSAADRALGRCNDDATGDDVAPDTGGDIADEIPAGAIANYILCDDDLDCPNDSSAGAYGDCIVRIPLNRPDGSSTTVSVTSLFGGLGGRAGVCSQTCSTGAARCDDLFIRDARGTDVPFTCQVVYRGAAPYPAGRTDFPFDDELVPADLAAGTPFAALCRPPFTLAQEVIREFCDACDTNADCGDGICYNAALGGLATDVGFSGECLTPCDGDTECPLGFGCQELDGGDYCPPIGGTCGPCVDGDGDGFGDGRCGFRDTVTGHDCDDANENAWYDAADRDHPFPEFCGAFDYNCNGLSDASEEIGAAAYPVEHCTACFDRCQGELPLGDPEDFDSGSSYGCVAGTGGSACVAVCDNPTEWADCDGPENGCEVRVDNDDFLVYRDADGDGAGIDCGAQDCEAIPVPIRFVCDPDNPPEGYVANEADCDDSEDADNVYGSYGDVPAALELCDGRNNDCDVATADYADDDTHAVGARCLDLSGATPSCGTSTVAQPGAGWTCAGAGGWVCTADTRLGTSCNTGALGICASGTWQCDGVGEVVCVGPEPAATDPLFNAGGMPDQTDPNCDGHDGDLAKLAPPTPCTSVADCVGALEPGACRELVCAAGRCQSVPDDALAGEACDDGDACTSGETCVAGTCGGGSLTDCSSLDTADCVLGTCEPTTGACVATTAWDGHACNDGDPCTRVDACFDGVCAGVPRDCSAVDGPCLVGACVQGECVAELDPAQTGDPCVPDDVCVVNATCGAGGCTGMYDDGNPACATPCTSPLDCPAPGPCEVMACVAGLCLSHSALNGTPCDDGAPCTVDDSCLSGSCQPGPPLVCNDPDPNDCEVPVCVGGTCVDEDAAVGASCDANPCLSGEVCDDQGVCGGGDWSEALCGCDDDGDCDDARACTDDVCNVGGTCLYTVVDDTCLIDGSCYGVGDPHPSLDTCACDPALDPEGWTCGPCGDGTLDVGELCDDGNLVAGDGCDAACQLEPQYLVTYDDTGSSFELQTIHIAEGGELMPVATAELPSGPTDAQTETRDLVTACGRTVFVSDPGDLFTPPQLHVADIALDGTITVRPDDVTLPDVLPSPWDTSVTLGPMAALALSCDAERGLLFALLYPRWTHDDGGASNWHLATGVMALAAWRVPADPNGVPSLRSLRWATAVNTPNLYGGVEGLLEGRLVRHPARAEVTAFFALESGSRIRTEFARWGYDEHGVLSRIGGPGVLSNDWNEINARVSISPSGGLLLGAGGNLTASGKPWFVETNDGVPPSAPVRIGINPGPEEEVVVYDFLMTPTAGAYTDARFQPGSDDVFFLHDRDSGELRAGAFIDGAPVLIGSAPNPTVGGSDFYRRIVFAHDGLILLSVDPEAGAVRSFDVSVPDTPLEVDEVSVAVGRSLAIVPSSKGDL